MNNLLTEEDYDRAAASLACNVEAIKAVAQVESTGTGFLPNGQPKILFEAHVFSRLTGHAYDSSHPHISSLKWDRSLYRSGDAEYARLQEAKTLDYYNALMSASWGTFQIMGFNHALCGFDDVRGFVQDMQISEGRQLDAFVTLIKHNPLLHGALKIHDWRTVAYRYNGSGYKQNTIWVAGKKYSGYDKGLEAAYNELENPTTQ